MSLISFADELLEFLFRQSNLSFIDIINLSKTCKRFYTISRSDEIWLQLYKRNFQCCPRENTFIFNIFKETYGINKRLLQFMTQLARKTYDYDGIPKSSYQEIEELFNEGHCIKPILDVLFGLAYEREQDNLTQKYYAERIYQYVLQYDLKLKWMKLLDYCGVFGSSRYKTELEEGAILIAKWNNIDSKINEDEVTQKLDAYADLVKQKIPPGWLENDKLVDSVERTRKILATINDVFYNDLEFHGNRTHYYDIRNSFINEVLKRKCGIPISLSVIYMSIARRLNLNVEGVNFPGHFLIRVISPLPSGENVHNYIDCFDNGRILDEDECVQRFLPDMTRSHYRDIFQKADKLKIFIRMVANIVNILRQNTILNTRNLDGLISCLELILLLDPSDIESKLLLARLYLHQGINLEEVVESLQFLFTSSSRNVPGAVIDCLLSSAKERQTEKINHEVKKRSSSSHSEVAFRVGMIMKHKRYHYRCVIYGWDPVCCMSESWKMRMGVYDLQDGHKQPFYNVLAADGSSRYAAQESLYVDDTNRPITHSDVGKYFIKYCDNHYEANELLNEYYPEDQPLPLCNMDFPGS